MKIVRLAMAVAMVSALGFVFQQAAKAEPFKLSGDPKPAWLYFDVKSDGGWTQAIHESKLKIENHLGWEIPFVEKVPEVVSKIKPAAERYIKRGYNIILGSAYGYSDAFKELAEKYPDVAFINPGGNSNAGNLQAIYGRS